MDDELLEAVLDRLGEHKLGPEAEVLLLAACEGDDQLERALGGERLARSAPVGGTAEEPELAYLASLEVAGFRGIGPASTLRFAPGPGLTLVVGRNGSGKSSFAEALELLLSGQVRRWQGLPAVFQQGWRNLHHPDASLRLVLDVEGAGRAVVERTWASGQDLDGASTTVQVRGEKRAGLERLGWSQALNAYRPFLAHSELESLLGRPSDLHDRLVEVLGLDELTMTSRRLKAATKAAEEPLKKAKDDLQTLTERLRRSDDERAAACLAALGKRTWDIGTAERVATGAAPAPDEGQLGSLRRLAALSPADGEAVAAVARRLRDAAVALEAATGSEAGRARELVSLLEAALEYHGLHGDGDCPVCGRTGALDSAWREQAQAAVAQFREEAAAADAAHAAAKEAEDAYRALVATFPADLQLPGELRGLAGAEAATSALEEWARAPGGEGADGLRARAGHLEGAGTRLVVALKELCGAAGALLAEQEGRWASLASEVAAWCQAARSAQAAAERAAPLKEADKWLTSAIDDLRNRRLRPLADQCRAIWAELRQESNVELGDLRLKGSGTRREVDFRVSVDGSEGAGLSVMSQGEVNALALAVFLPRATLPQSPFGFLVIDDPVQAMDPAKVEGLARVLSATASKRQVLVFTHDDRLPEAVRRLGLDATVVEVTRRLGSVVEVRPALDPASRALADARAVSNDDVVPEEVARRVVGGLCRLALEAAFAAAHRRRRLASGEAHQKVEDELLATSTSLYERAALAIYGDARRGGDVLSRLNAWGSWAADTFKACNSGAHGPYPGGLRALVGDTERLVA